MGKYFITGVTGSLGQAVLKKLLSDKQNQVIGYSRDELKQSQMLKHPRLSLYLGDIRDQRRLIEASRGVDVIFHFAALKRVDSMEENPEECIATNVEGTANVLGAQRMNKIKRVVLSSTDKAAHPETVYGACKLLSERLVLRNPSNVVCRYGNVLASRGSVIPYFIETIREEGSVNITHADMTRFFLTIDDAAQFVTQAAHNSRGGLKIPDLKACRIVDLAYAVAECMGARKPNIKIMGIRGIEKLHECLIMPCEGQPMHSNTAPQYGHKELVALVRPIVESLTGKNVIRKRPSLRVMKEGHA